MNKYHVKACPKIKVFILLLLPIISLKVDAANSASCAPSITIAPYLGIDTTKLVMLSLYNQDILLLQQRKDLVKHNPNIARQCPSIIFELSGMMAPLLNVTQYKSVLVNLDSAELDFVSHIRDEGTLFFDFAYSNQPISTVGQLGNSKITLDRVFITIGNFNHSPFYFTLGRRYVPFGQYYSYMISGTIGQTLAKVEASSLLIGYTHPSYSGLYAAFYGIKSVKKLFWDGNQKPIGGFTVGYNVLDSSFGYDIGLDYIQSISSAQGFQAVGVDEQVPGVDLHIKANLKNFTLTAEFTTAISKFNAAALGYYNHGARPAALYYELGYQLSLFSKSSSIAIGYGKTSEAVQLNLPANVFNVAYNISLNKHAILSTQYQHNINYPSNSMGLSEGKSYTYVGKNIIYVKLIAYF